MKMKTSPTKQVASMLRNTMLHLKQRKGVSLVQIRKHLEANYSMKLDSTNKKRLATALKGLVQIGKVEKTPTGVYKLKKTEDNEGDKAEVPNRRRSFPKGYCKSHTRYHRSHRRRRRSHRRRSHRRRRHHRRRRRFPGGYCKTHTRYHRKRRR